MKRLLVLTLLLIGGKIALSQVADPGMWAPNGPVNTLLLRDSILYVGGDFTQVSPVTGKFVSCDSLTAAVSPPLLFVDGKVNCMIKDSSGYIYVGGAFSHAGNYLRTNLFRLTPQGNVDTSFSPDPDGEVFAFTIYENTLFFGGNFLSVSGYGRTRGAAIYIAMNSATMTPVDTLTPFDPQSNGPIYALYPDIAGLGILVGGDFMECGGHTNAYLCKLKPETGMFMFYGNTPWSAFPQSSGAIRTIYVYRDWVYVGGDFNSFISIGLHGLGMLDRISGAVIPAYNAGINGYVRDIEAVGKKIYIGGSFTIVDGQPRKNVACIDTFLNVLPWNPSADNDVYSLQEWDSTSICIGGAFHVMGSDTIDYAAIVDMDSLGTVHQWNGKFDAPVYAMMPATAGGQVWVGGDFSGAGGVYRNNLFALNTNTGMPDNWRPKVNYPVTTMTADNSQLFISGPFSTVNGQSRNRLASFDLATRALSSFNPGVNGLVRTMVSDNSDLYLGGNFSDAGGQTRNNLARINIGTGITSSWNPGCAGTVNKILLDGDNVYLGGFFSQTGGQFRDNLAKVSATTGLADWTWSCNTDNGIYDMDIFNGKLFIGGWFQNAGGQPRNYFASVDTAAGTLLPFSPAIDDYIRLFTRWNDDLFISGPFISVNGNQYRPRLCNYDLGDGMFDTWAPVPSAFPDAMQASQNWLYIGGTFNFAGFYYHPNLARVNINYVTDVPQNDFPSTMQLKLWPNPTEDFVFVTIDQGWGKTNTIQVIDVNGKIVKEMKISSCTASFVSVDLRDLSPALYTVRVLDNNGNEGSSRVIKK